MHVLRTLKSEGTARAIELIEASRGRIPHAQAWMLLQRLMARGAVRIHRRVDNERGGLPVPVYKLTAHGNACIRAMKIMGVE